MTSTDPLEDERGVDVSQIRRQLALTPAERVERMVAIVNRWDDVRDHVRRGREER